MNTELKLLVAALLLGSVVSLGKALFHMSVDADGSARMARALTLRIVFSIALFALLMLGWYLGWISPHGVRGVG